jgi:hypothetical protein
MPHICRLPDHLIIILNALGSSEYELAHVAQLSPILSPSSYFLGITIPTTQLNFHQLERKGEQPLVVRAGCDSFGVYWRRVNWRMG